MFVEGDDNETDHDCQENFAFDEPSPQYEKRLLKDMLLGRDPLYAGSSITLLDAMCTLFVFFLTFHFSKAAFQKILDLLHVVLLPSHFLPTTTEAFLSPFSSGNEEKIIFHEYCPTCCVKYQDEEIQCRWCKGWRYQGGKEEQSKKKLKDFFLELPIQKDIEELFQGSFFQKFFLEINNKKKFKKFKKIFRSHLSSRNPISGHKKTGERSLERHP